MHISQWSQVTNGINKMNTIHDDLVCTQGDLLAAEKAAIESLERHLPIGSTLQRCPDLTERVAPHVASLSLPWTVRGYGLMPNEVAIDKADGTRSVYPVTTIAGLIGSGLLFVNGTNG